MPPSNFQECAFISKHSSSCPFPLRLYNQCWTWGWELCLILVLYLDYNKFGQVIHSKSQTLLKYFKLEAKSLSRSRELNFSISLDRIFL